MMVDYSDPTIWGCSWSMELANGTFGGSIVSTNEEKPEACESGEYTAVWEANISIR